MKRNVLAVFLAVLMALSLAACGGSAKYTASSASYAGGAMEETAAAPAAMADKVAMTAAEAPREEAKAESGALTEDGGNGALPQKLIRTAHLEMETTSFDEAVAALEEATVSYGGYFENNSIANHNNGARWANYTIRIPAEELDRFLAIAGELCHVTWQELMQDDISEVYYDTEGRLKTQQIKLERLQELLSKAEDMEDIITIESAISETEWNIENLSGTLRHYDAKVNYSTVYVNLQEVYKLSNVEEVPDTFAQRMGASFRRGITNFVDTLEDIAVDLAYGWMWWLLGIGAVVIVVRVVKKGFRMPKWKLGRKKKNTPDKPKE